MDSGHLQWLTNAMNNGHLEWLTNTIEGVI